MSILRLVLVVAVVSVAAACATVVPWIPSSAIPPAANVAGAWELTIESPMGSQISDALFTQSGAHLTGKIVSPRGELPLTGSVQGDALQFALNVNVQGQDLTIDYAGKVAGDSMGGTVQFGAFGNGKWSGRKKR